MIWQGYYTIDERKRETKKRRKQEKRKYCHLLIVPCKLQLEKQNIRSTLRHWPPLCWWRAECEHGPELFSDVFLQQRFVSGVWERLRLMSSPAPGMTSQEKISVCHWWVLLLPFFWLFVVYVHVCGFFIFIFLDIVFPSMFPVSLFLKYCICFATQLALLPLLLLQI